jgi:hypothetical protein
MNYSVKVIKNGRTIQRQRTHSIRRFVNNLRSINWENMPLKVYLRVSYGRGEEVHGKTVNFYNEGSYENKDDLFMAFNAFIEK